MSIWTKWLRREPAVAAVVVDRQAPEARSVVAPNRPRAPLPDASLTDLTIDQDAKRDALETLQAPFLGWLLGTLQTPAGESPASADPRLATLLARLDAATATDAQCNALLPRAPQVVPQLMKALRDEHYASTDVAERVSKDAELAAEVIRMANRGQRSDREPVADLAHAVTAIGSDGMRRVIARSVLRPMFDARGTSLSARAAPQIWKDSDRKARLAAALAANDLLDPLDGYLAGLLHNTGWTAALRAIDVIPKGAAQLQSAVIDASAAEAFARRRDTLFGRLVRPWDLSPTMNALADEVGTLGLAGVRSPLGRALHYADRVTMLHAVARSERLPGADFAGHLDRLPAPVRNCYVTTLGRA